MAKKYYVTARNTTDLEPLPGWYVHFEDPETGREFFYRFDDPDDADEFAPQIVDPGD